MWVFVYGSLMWDGWEKEKGCIKSEIANLSGFHRSFNKKSIKNWGTKEVPCPTLNLIKNESSFCCGKAFEFSDSQEDSILKYLCEREGKNFNKKVFSIQPVRMQESIKAFVFIYTGKNLIESASTEDLAAMIRLAKGEKGSGMQYLEGLVKNLKDSGIDDNEVNKLWAEVQQSKQQ